MWMVARFDRIETSPDKVSFQNKSKNDLLNISRHDSRLWPNKAEIPRHYTTNARGRCGAGRVQLKSHPSKTHMCLYKKKGFRSTSIYTTNTIQF